MTKQILQNETMVFVYELPKKLSSGFCFGSGQQIPFLNVDWFNGFDGVTEMDLINHVKSKSYIKHGQTYLILSPENAISCMFVGGHTS
ncbi:hypothetical protein [uncultured Cohaesibacter sp.]|uniref:hypothetical protein n=1 Tax=uncultured Cohaesibacter sp. TaxID=1002546 RepID=UPI00292D2EB5|nr:hypothetical protein [uncultured Cohaesibacter sp.]